MQHERSKWGRRARFRFPHLIRFLSYRESDPVAAGEVLLRAIPKQHVKHDPLNGLFIDGVAFRPHDINDIDGLSFFREDFLSPRSLAYHRPRACVVARFQVAELRKEGLDPVAAPDSEQPPGHVVIPAIKSGMDKRRRNELQFVLAELAKLDIALEWNPPPL